MSEKRMSRNMEKILRGSLIENRHTCGKKNCRCAKGELHLSIYFARTVNGKQLMTSIPKPLVPVVRQWVEKHCSFEQAAKEQTEINLLRLLGQYREKTGKRGKT